MKKVAVLTLIATLNLGGAAGELIFQDGFESGWPNAWAESVGWSAYVVKDSAGTLVGPVVGFWTRGDEANDPVGAFLVAAKINGEKVIFKALQDRLITNWTLLFAEAGCQGQAYLCFWDGFRLCSGFGSIHADVAGVAYAVAEGNLLYKAGPPAVNDFQVLSYIKEQAFSEYQCSDLPSAEMIGNGWQADPIVDLDTLFTPPFAAE